MSARPRPAAARDLAPALRHGLERMVRIQMEAAPSHWSEADRRAWAEELLLRRRPAA